MGCNIPKPKQKDLKLYDPKLQQIVTVPVLFEAKNNPIVKRRLHDQSFSPEQKISSGIHL
ncbi:unnamed protein product [Paramecium octaurelia]|uniref:Uncharacterized protein n=1 Tax=Paramecium octaurelia TaxID=43137 RepID=A0A8S1W060_PAROT|nr:unnamed protein product [Paramecium octaurelia]